MNKLTVDLLLEANSNANNIISVKSTDKVEDVAQTLKKHKIGLVLVIDDGKLAGVVSERDLVQRWICGPQFPKSMSVKDIMTKNVEVVTAFDNIRDCYLRFVARNCRHLPVLDPMGNVLGVLSLRNVVDYLVNEWAKSNDL